MAYKHLTFSREETVNDRHKRPDPRSAQKSAPSGHGAALLKQFERERYQPQRKDIGGFDERRLIKIKIRAGQRTPDFTKIPGVDVVSYESGELVLAFATDEGLQTFENRLGKLSSGGHVTHAELLLAIQDFGSWTAEERMGRALKEKGFPEGENMVFVLDAELWPQPNPSDNTRALRAFVEWAKEQDIDVRDHLNLPSLVLVRMKLNRTEAERVLEHRDVRQVDLPPHIGIGLEDLTRDIERLPAVGAPPEDAPIVGILDSGLTSRHPLFGTAVGNSEGFLAPDFEGNDNTVLGHGTFVAGLALHGDLGTRLDEEAWIPRLRIFSGKVFDDIADNDSELVENAVTRAVRALHSQYGCRVFTLCYGDLNRVYDGGHIRGLAYVIDHLSRELGVLFVVPTGNITSLPDDPLREYPDYLFGKASRLLDPATALHALTVGSIARYVKTRDSQRHAEKIEDVPIAQTNCPSPFTRTGFSINGAIKPDLVEHGGNLAVSRSGSGKHPDSFGLGVLSLNSGFSSGYPLREGSGTSYAAPVIANKAALLTGSLPNQNVDTIRALLAANAYWPRETVTLLDPNNKKPGRTNVLRAVGYGVVSDRALYESQENEVTLIAEAKIANDKYHFYELPIPEDFWIGRGQRARQISVALAHRPDVRTTRIGYSATRISFSVVKSESLAGVAVAYKKGREKGLPERKGNRLVSSQARNGGSLQMSRWEFRSNSFARDSFFVVVTRQDASWSDSKDEDEEYSLVVVLHDLEAEASRLYTQVEALLRVRNRERERVRVRA